MAHVIGEGDVNFSEQGRRLVDLCNSRTRKVTIHRGRHHFPRGIPTIIKVVQAIESTLERAVPHG